MKGKLVLLGKYGICPASIRGYPGRFLRVQSLTHALKALVIILAASATANSAVSAAEHIRLVGALDEPEFYCVDLAGWGEHLKLDDPLQTHTCKRRGAQDQMFSIVSGQIKATHYDRCLQVAGSGRMSLPGSAVIARTCTASPLQSFVFEDSGLLRIKDSEYCIGAGGKSEEASGPSHLWRTLTVVQCDVDNVLHRWQWGLK